ncbi:MAG TPA: hypothetical protein VG675_16885 [Bryobacteraceae bacterium]|nr:hypothetical protein [Bryobacteraceae bacterium]
MPELDKHQEEKRQKEVDEAFAEIRKLAKRTGKATIEELLSARDEGRKY